MVRGVLRQEARIEHLVLRPADRPKDRARPELAGERHVLLAKDLLHERLLVVRVVDHEPPVDADGLAIRPQDARAERVEGAGLDVAAAFADEADDPLAKFGRRPVREGDRKDPPRGHPVDADEVRDPVREDAGLAGAGAGQDQQRALGRGDGAGLLRVEHLDDLGGPGLAGGRDRFRVHRRRRGGRVRGRAGGRRLGQPGRLLGHRDPVHRLVRERRPGRFVEPQRGDVGRGVAGPATSGRAHLRIVERGVDPAFTRLSSRACTVDSTEPRRGIPSTSDAPGSHASPATPGGHT